jgi:hypothetical protein
MTRWENWKKKSEIRNQKSEIRNQKSEIRNKKSEIRIETANQKAGIFYLPSDWLFS